MTASGKRPQNFPKEPWSIGKPDFHLDLELLSYRCKLQAFAHSETQGQDLPDRVNSCEYDYEFKSHRDDHRGHDFSQRDDQPPDGCRNLLFACRAVPDFV